MPELEEEQPADEIAELRAIVMAVNRQALLSQLIEYPAAAENLGLEIDDLMQYDKICRGSFIRMIANKMAHLVAIRKQRIDDERKLNQLFGKWLAPDELK